MAVNLTPSGGDTLPPHLDLFFDTSGHGTHVAGIAAGRTLYDIPGFDGVAPGADLLGLKIANNASGGITTTGSIIRAMAFAVALAERRRQPLVLNLSFGVGNEVEGTARIDQLVDSILQVHPNLVMTVSAGNDGPGVSTLGFPGSAARVISVGATYPAVFLPRQPGVPLPADPVAFFSARGGEINGPHIVAPGMAYSTVPRWDTGNEEKSGTSMAAPHVAGLVARMLSGLSQEQRPMPSAAQVRQALMVTAKPVQGASAIDDGSGLPVLSNAYEWLRSGHAVDEVEVRAVDHGVSGIVVEAGHEQAKTVAFAIRHKGKGTLRVTLEPSDPWLTTPATLELQSQSVVPVTIDFAQLGPGPGVWTGVVYGWGPSRSAGPLFRLVTTVIAAADSGQGFAARGAISPGGQQRVPFQTEVGRPFEVEVQTSRPEENVLAFLHEPGGRPFRVEQGVAAGFGARRARIIVDGRDAQGGRYEVVSVAPPGSRATVTVAVVQAPIRVETQRDADGIVVETTNLTTMPVPAKLAMELIGAERIVLATGRGDAPYSIPFTIPAWARRLQVEATFDRVTWAHVTDIGLTLLDPDGTPIATAPLDYASDRLDFDRDPGKDRQHILRVLPGFADPASQEFWSAGIRIRLYAAAPVEVPLPESDLVVMADTPTTVHLPMPTVPWFLGDAFFPLGRVKTRTGNHLWSFELPLPPPLRPAQP